jgi:Sperm-tail PG-rich repeat
MLFSVSDRFTQNQKWSPGPGYYFDEEQNQRGKISARSFSAGVTRDAHINCYIQGGLLSAPKKLSLNDKYRGPGYYEPTDRSLMKKSFNTRAGRSS